MEGKRLLHSISLKNLLSYGSEGVTLELEPLNVLIGPNASGKSNLIDAISLLAAAPRNLMTPFLRGAPTADWLWKKRSQDTRAQISVVIEPPYSDTSGSPLVYELEFIVPDVRPQIVSESLTSKRQMHFFRRPLEIVLPERQELQDLESQPRYPERPDPQVSVLAQIRSPHQYPQLTYVGDSFGKISFFRGWPFGRDSQLAQPQRVDLPDDFLLQDGSNLGLVLNDLQNRRTTKRLLLEKLQTVYEGIDDVTTKTQGGTIRIFFHEKGLDEPLSAASLSDGILHYLGLLTVLLHPEPPPLICIEEPEMGLHPDILPKIADLLLDAAKRTQLIVTTHSETLVSRLSEFPETVVVCERDDRGTQLRRLEPDKLRVWLDKYMLGELWRMGEIGGNRW